MRAFVSPCAPFGTDRGEKRLRSGGEGNQQPWRALQDARAFSESPSERSGTVGRTPKKNPVVQLPASRFAQEAQIHSKKKKKKTTAKKKKKS